MTLLLHDLTTSSPPGFCNVPFCRNSALLLHGMALLEDLQAVGEDFFSIFICLHSFLKTSILGSDFFKRYLLTCCSQSPLIKAWGM